MFFCRKCRERRKCDVPSHIYVLSCQRTEHRAVDRGPGYGGSVKKNVKRWEKEKGESGRIGIG